MSDIAALLLPECTCPDPLLARLRKKVKDQLDKVRSVARLTNSFGSAMGDVAKFTGDALQAACDAIPDPIQFDGLFTLEVLACPLFELATAVGIDDFQKQDPQVRLNIQKDLITDYLADVRRKFEDALKVAPDYKNIDAIRKYADEVRRLNFNVEDFLDAVLITAGVFAVCPTEFLDASAPYQSFAEETVSFALGLGNIPAGLNADVAKIVNTLNTAEGKFAKLKGSLI